MEWEADSLGDGGCLSDNDPYLSPHRCGSIWYKNLSIKYWAMDVADITSGIAMARVITKLPDDKQEKCKKRRHRYASI